MHPLKAILLIMLFELLIVFVPSFEIAVFPQHKTFPRLFQLRITLETDRKQRKQKKISSRASLPWKSVRLWDCAAKWGKFFYAFTQFQSTRSQTKVSIYAVVLWFSSRNARTFLLPRTLFLVENRKFLHVDRELDQQFVACKQNPVDYFFPRLLQEPLYKQDYAC